MDWYGINLFALPVVVLVGGVLWYRYDRRLEPAWRRWIVVAGLLGVCGDIAVFVRWQLYMHGTPDTITGGLMRQQAMDIGLVLSLFALASAIAGKGVARGVLALASIMGLVIWVLPMFL